MRSLAKMLAKKFDVTIQQQSSGFRVGTKTLSLTIVTYFFGQKDQSCSKIGELWQKHRKLVKCLQKLILDNSVGKRNLKQSFKNILNYTYEAERTF